MRTLLISYDLNKPGKDYDRVIAYIKSLGPWAKPLRSQWLVITSLRPLEIVDGLRLHGVDQGDSLFVVDISKDYAAWFNLSPAVVMWIKENVKPEPR